MKRKEISLLKLIERICNNNGVCGLNEKHFIDELSITKEELYDSLKQLEKEGMVSITRRFGLKFISLPT